MIKTEALTRTYGDFTAVDQVSFKIGRGEIVGLLGHNGAGKTTIMKMLTGYLEPTSGHIEIDGLDIRVDREAIQRKIGYLPENCPVYPEMTVIDYLDYAASLHGVPENERPSRVREAIAKTALEEKAMQPISTLSRGYRQRTGVAQALLHNPDILILDEPTNGLDPAQIQHMRDLIRSLAKQATVILSTHILQEVQAICDRVIIIRSGRVALDARMEELRSGNRLLVAVDTAPDKTQSILKSVQGVRSVATLDNDGRQYRYALELAQQEADEAAPLVSKALIDKGCKLYGLQRERRDLETVFGEISGSRAAGGASHG
ncbi:MAG TPA: ABC transporter ATP-binding protein [Gammaproteobacteria bacterium]|nr:ABC transporter ATP-binding protein [Gammaproteobacteria bacterium]